MGLLDPSIDERTAARFIARHFPEATVADVFPTPRYDGFLGDVRSNKEVAAAKAYHDLNAGKVEEARFAVVVAKELLDK